MTEILLKTEREIFSNNILFGPIITTNIKRIIDYHKRCIFYIVSAVFARSLNIAVILIFVVFVHCRRR